MNLNLLTRTRAGLSLGSITGNDFYLDNPNPSLTYEGPSVYSPDGRFLAYVKPSGTGFTVLTVSDKSVYLDVCLFFNTVV